jgi:hypothetical protein
MVSAENGNGEHLRFMTFLAALSNCNYMYLSDCLRPDLSDNPQIQAPRINADAALRSELNT